MKKLVSAKKAVVDNCSMQLHIADVDLDGRDHDIARPLVAAGAVGQMQASLDFIFLFLHPPALAIFGRIVAPLVNRQMRGVIWGFERLLLMSLCQF